MNRPDTFFLRRLKRVTDPKILFGEMNTRHDPLCYEFVRMVCMTIKFLSRDGVRSWYDTSAT